MSFTKTHSAYPETQINETKDGLHWVARIYQPVKQDPSRPIDVAGIPDECIFTQDGSVTCDLSNPEEVTKANNQCRLEARNSIAKELAKFKKPEKS